MQTLFLKKKKRRDGKRKLQGQLEGATEKRKYLVRGSLVGWGSYIFNGGSERVSQKVSHSTGPQCSHYSRDKIDVFYLNNEEILIWIN